MKIYLWSEYNDEIWGVVPMSVEYDSRNFFTTRDNEIVTYIKTNGYLRHDLEVGGEVWELKLDD